MQPCEPCLCACAIWARGSHGPSAPCWQAPPCATDAGGKTEEEHAATDTQLIFTSASDVAPATATLDTALDAGRGGGGAGAESLRDRPALQTTSEAAPAVGSPRTVVAEGRASGGTGGSGESSGAALRPGEHAPGAGHQPANRPMLPPVEHRGGKLGGFAGMVRTSEAQLERSLEDVTGPIDPRQVQKSSRYPQPSRLELPCLCVFFCITPKPRVEWYKSL